ncbi:MAG TPA: polysaccharide biosynthesis/export family protein [Terriglobia bacterium]|nr:polysaccharide biosynthesis/export family protein [Terriglobia bacterium]
MLCISVAIISPARAQSPSSVTPGTPASSLQPPPQEQQEITAPAPVPSPMSAPPEYRIGTGDVLGITIYNMVELNRTAVVGSEGALVLSYFPRPIQINGKTTMEVGQDVASELKQLQILVDPQVSVAVIRVQSKPVVVGGSVRSPQVLQEMRPLTLQEVLMLAGGPEQGAGNSVLVTRDDGAGNAVSYDLSLKKVLSGTDPNFNIPVNPGDTVQVLPDQKVFVAGDVKSPGAFPLGRGERLTVSKLMALTGGWRGSAKASKAVIVRDDAHGKRQTVPLDLPKIMARKTPDVALEANDLVYIPGSTGKAIGLTAIKGIGGAAMLGTGYLIIRH